MHIQDNNIQEQRFLGTGKRVSVCSSVSLGKHCNTQEASQRIEHQQEPFDVASSFLFGKFLSLTTEAASFFVSPKQNDSKNYLQRRVIRRTPARRNFAAFSSVPNYRMCIVTRSVTA